MKVEEMIVVAEYKSSVEAEMAKSILACAGIDAFIEYEVQPIRCRFVRSRLVVDLEHYNQARTLLRIRE